MDDKKRNQGTPSCWRYPRRYSHQIRKLRSTLAYQVLSDFEKTFIQCIVYNFEILKELGDEAAVKAAGKVLTKGKDYIVEDGDIILIKAGAAKS